MSARAFSAPGKALLAGGYLVLEPIYNAYVTALSSRMHALIEGEVSPNSTFTRITIRSPQFQDGEWCYEFDLAAYTKFNPVEVNGRYNPFTEATVSTILSYINSSQNHTINILIFSDPGYHSQQNTTVKESSNSKKKFLYHSETITKVAKTGLGSSAGLVSVLTTALISYFKPGSDITGKPTKDLIHKLAQVAHCIAQKKIGSGFDVAAAVYGSIIYRRFQPKLINDLINGSFATAEYSKALQKLVASNWEFTSENCGLPPRIKLLMGDVCGGSETPKLVSKVLQWKKNDLANSGKVYNELNKANLSLIESLSGLTEFHAQDPKLYNELIDYFSQRKLSSVESYIQLQPELKENLEPFLKLINSIKKIRANLRLLTSFTGADIEPIEQTLLLNQCNNLKGVLGGVVPGAGGYDAICLLVIEDCIDDIVKETSSNHDSIDSDTVYKKMFENVTWLNLHEEEQGIVVENISDYVGLF